MIFIASLIFRLTSTIQNDLISKLELFVVLHADRVMAFYGLTRNTALSAVSLTRNRGKTEEKKPSLQNDPLFT